MPRTISAALTTELAKTVTQVGYLVEIDLASGTVRWSNIGTVSWNSQTWTDRDFRVEGLAFDVDADVAGRITFQNLDNAVAALFLDAGESMPALTVTVYQFAAGALAAGDVPKMAELAIADCEVTLAAVTLSVREKSDAQFCPVRNISPAYSFNYATPPGYWFIFGEEIFTVEAEDNG